MSEWDETTLSQEELTAFMVLAGSIGESKRENERMREAMQEFVDRCERGEVLSKYTYTKFKGILEPA